MTTYAKPQISSLALAAQADVLMITVEMLRSPQAVLSSPVEPWFNLPLQALLELLNTAFGSLLARAESANTEGTEPTETPTLPEGLSEVHELAKQLDSDLWSDEYYRLFDSSQACAEPSQLYPPRQRDDHR